MRFNAPGERTLQTNNVANKAQSYRSLDPDTHPRVLVGQQQEAATVSVQPAHGHQPHLLAPGDGTDGCRPAKLVRHRADHPLGLVQRNPLYFGARPHEHAAAVDVYLISSRVNLPIRTTGRYDKQTNSEKLGRVCTPVEGHSGG